MNRVSELLSRLEVHALFLRLSGSRSDHVAFGYETDGIHQVMCQRAYERLPSFQLSIDTSLLFLLLLLVKRFEL